VATTFSLAFDCSDAARLMAFWAEALGYQFKPPPAGFDDWSGYFRSIGVPEAELRGSADVYLVDPDGIGPQIFFQEVPEGKVVKNRIHLDLRVGGGREVPLDTRRRRVEAEADRLAALGATRVRVYDAEVVDHYFVVMQDPEGNEFCVI
jgi:hypothetical protein